MRIGDRIREARLRASLTQQQCATHAGVTIATLRSWETCAVSPRLDDLATLARVLDCPIGALVGES
jgi:transcriptional regulator with XRE-family HTH domain